MELPKQLTPDQQAALIGIKHFQENLKGALLYKKFITGDFDESAEDKYATLISIGRFENNPRRTELIIRKSLGIITPEQLNELGGTE